MSRPRLSHAEVEQRRAALKLERERRVRIGQCIETACKRKAKKKRVRCAAHLKAGAESQLRWRLGKDRSA